MMLKKNQMNEQLNYVLGITYFVGNGNNITVLIHLRRDHSLLDYVTTLFTLLYF